MTTTITPQFASAAYKLQSRSNAQRAQVGYSSGNGFSSGSHSAQQPKFGLEPMTMGLSALGCCCLVPILAIGGMIAMLFRLGK
jgi:hypothetical protein